MDQLLNVENLRVSFSTPAGVAHAVNGISFTVNPGEILGLVGESGCGKSLSALALLGLAGPTAKVSGRASFRGTDLLSARQSSLEQIRGRDLAMIFQDPVSALNPIMTIGTQTGEALRLGTESACDLDADRIRRQVVDLLHEVGIPQPAQRLGTYPHELSGGMCQRVMIAMMLARRPSLLIADEPTTALDVTVQAQILSLLRRLRESRGMAIILITHDLGVVAQTCDRVAVMYCGRIVETAPVDTLFARPRHPYTAGLLGARASVTQREKDLVPIQGIVPPPTARPPGCDFEPRCRYAVPMCRTEAVALEGEDHQCACRNPLTHSMAA